MRNTFEKYTPFGSIYRNRELLGRLAIQNIQTRYRGSILGPLWMLATPLVLLTVYTFVFSVIFKARWGEGVHF